ncbi:hypothetical protein E4T56_gene3625 [Termitomyces sp. T112]|nr:hypothetical protein E4T56_gene3625 [Termitomyces sp. T112]
MTPGPPHCIADALPATSPIAPSPAATPGAEPWTPASTHPESTQMPRRHRPGGPSAPAPSLTPENELSVTNGGVEDHSRRIPARPKVASLANQSFLRLAASSSAHSASPPGTHPCPSASPAGCPFICIRRSRKPHTSNACSVTTCTNVFLSCSITPFSIRAMSQSSLACQSSPSHAANDIVKASTCLQRKTSMINFTPSTPIDLPSNPSSTPIDHVASYPFVSANLHTVFCLNPAKPIPFPRNLTSLDLPGPVQITSHRLSAQAISVQNAFECPVASARGSRLPIKDLPSAAEPLESAEPDRAWRWTTSPPSTETGTTTITTTMLDPHPELKIHRMIPMTHWPGRDILCLAPKQTTYDRYKALVTQVDQPYWEDRSKNTALRTPWNASGNTNWQAGATNGIQSSISANPANPTPCFPLGRGIASTNPPQGQRPPAQLNATNLHETPEPLDTNPNDHDDIPDPANNQEALCTNWIQNSPWIDVLEETQEK